jgi:TolB protein
MKKYLVLIPLATACAAFLTAQTQRNLITIESGAKPAIAVPDFRGSGDAQNFMNAFNATLFADLQDSGQFSMVPKTVMPLHPPQQPSDIKADGVQGHSMGDWSGPPPNSNYLAFGYTAAVNGQIVLYGWLYDVRQSTNPQMIGKVYTGTLDEAGARSVAQQFAADILKKFGATGLVGTKIYFTSDRTGHKEIWSMDYDGSNQKQITSYKSISTFPVVSPDGSKIAFTTYSRGRPEIFVHSLASGRKLPYYNQNASMNAASDFTPDSLHLLIYSTAGASYSQIFMTDADGGNLRRVAASRSPEVEPKVNPKNSSVLVFVSGRSGFPQIYTMNSDGVDVARLTSGEGEAVNPAWNPDGQHIAFAWTRGFDPGNYNIFVMDVASREFQQLTHGAGRCENPVWAPDGIHLVYSSKRGRSTEIWTMLADGTGQRQLTTQGNNEKPVWGKAVE